jgi:hypothetical protein
MEVPKKTLTRADILELMMKQPLSQLAIEDWKDVPLY